MNTLTLSTSLKLLTGSTEYDIIVVIITIRFAINVFNLTTFECFSFVIPRNMTETSVPPAIYLFCIVNLHVKS